jgi:flagellar basal-body rod modification protein FlgD
MTEAVNGASNTTQQYSASSLAPEQSQSLGKDAFMQLLVSQMRNQDPMSPTSNEDFIAQLAQFSSLEQMEELNGNILGLAVLQQSNALMSQLTDSSALIGKEVRFIDPESGDELVGNVTSVKIQDGLAILNIDGEDVPLGNVTEITGADDATELPDDSTTDESNDAEDGEEQA